MKNIIIIFGGKSCEHDISIITALTINNVNLSNINKMLIYMKNGKFYLSKKLQNLRNYINFREKNFFEVTFSCGKMHFLNKYKKSIDIDCAIICNHGGVGENGALSGYLEIAEIPYTAPDPFGCALFIDKVRTKNYLNSIKCPTVESVTYNKGDSIDLIDDFGYPVILKPASQGSSIGISIVKNKDELVEKLNFALNFDKKILVEKALSNFIELNCAAYSVNGKIILSEIERPIYNSEYYDFETKYIDFDGISRELPAKIPLEIENAVYKYTERIYRTSEIKGVVRVDYLYDGNNLYVCEVNSIPGSLAFYLFKNRDISFKKLILDLVDEARRVYKEEEKLTNDFASKVLTNFNTVKLSDGVKK